MQLSVLHRGVQLESRFKNNGIFSNQNTRYSAQQNQHATKERNFQDRFDVNVLTGMETNQWFSRLFCDLNVLDLFI